MGSTSNIKVGPVKVTLGSTVLGYADEAWKVKFEQAFEDLKVFEHGDTVVGQVGKGGTITVTGTLAEFAPQFLAKALPFSTLSSGKVDVAFGAGADLYDKAEQLRLHPRLLGDGDQSQDVLFYKAACFGPVESAFDFSARKIPVQFRVFPDRTKLDLGTNPWGTYGS